MSLIQLVVWSSDNGPACFMEFFHWSSLLYGVLSLVNLVVHMSYVIDPACFMELCHWSSLLYGVLLLVHFLVWSSAIGPACTYELCSKSSFFHGVLSLVQLVVRSYGNIGPSFFIKFS